MKFLAWIASIIITGMVVGAGLRWATSDAPPSTSSTEVRPANDTSTPGTTASTVSAYQVGEYIQDIPEGSLYQPSGKVVDGFKEIAWEALMPEDWDPMAPLAKLDLASLDDNDPRAIEALKQAQLIWDKAPVNTTMDNTSVRIPGFVVALEQDDTALREFLLVPYFGACIHTPPPPANQIIHAKSNKAVSGVRTMDAVWVHGVLRVDSSDTTMGRSGYRMQVTRVEPYES